HALLPIEWFEEAELMSRRPCTIDHHTGFISYLQKHLHEWFDDVYDEDLLPLDLEVKIELDANGHMQGLEFYKNFDKRRLADRLESAFEDVDYWYPSFLDGEYIEDKLIFTCKVFPDKEQKKLSFFDLHLIR